MSETENLLKGLDYSVVQQCMRCGMCLAVCPTYDATLNERSSPRGRIALMRGIADGRLEMARAFAEELYFCLGCLACQTACPAGVDYATLFEHARAEIERVGLLRTPKRSLIRTVTVKWLFTSRKRLRRLGALLRFYQGSGLQNFVRESGLLRLLPVSLRDLEPLTPVAQDRLTEDLFRDVYRRENPERPKYRVGLLIGCVQDIAFADVNADTIYVLQQNGCEVALPEAQECCGSLHAHNGELDAARELARKNIDAFNAEDLDAVIANAGGCGFHMKRYGHLLAGDAEYAGRARVWSRKVRDIHEFLVEIGFRRPRHPGQPRRVTYHESCHLTHGQKVSDAPRQVLQAIPGITYVELKEADWCCGSAGIYNITQPEMAMRLLERKMGHIRATQAGVVAAANTGCAVQLVYGSQRCGVDVRVKHPVSLLAEAYRAEEKGRYGAAG